jgi:hypothetical protein
VAEEEKQAPEDASAEDLAAQLLKIKVSDLVVQNAVGLIQLGFIRLSGEQRDLAQARLAIDTLRALEPILREQVSVEMADELQSAITNMQLAFADAINEKTEPTDSAASPPPPESGKPAAADSSESGG